MAYLYETHIHTSQGSACGRSRGSDYIKCIYLSTSCVDAVEAANPANRNQAIDALALVYAKKLGVPVIAGSDTHIASIEYNDMLMGVYLNKKMENITDFVDAVLTNSLGPIKIPPGHCDIQGNEKESIMLPVKILDKDDQDSGRDLWDFLGN